MTGQAAADKEPRDLNRKEQYRKQCSARCIGLSQPATGLPLINFDLVGDGTYESLNHRLYRVLLAGVSSNSVILNQSTKGRVPSTAHR